MHEQPEQRTPTTWAPIDLTAILAGTYAPPMATLLPRTDGQHLLYPGATHSIHGEPESGKSLITQAECARLIADGRPVLYLDFESNGPDVVNRLRGIFGATDDDIAKHFCYVRPETSVRGTNAREDLEDLLRCRFDLAVIDGVNEAMTLDALSGESDFDVTLWNRLVPRRLAETGAAVALIDHVVKNAESRGRFAAGSQRKMAVITGAAYMVEVNQPCGQGRRGVLTLRLVKDRPGGLRGAAMGDYRHNDRSHIAATVVLDSTSQPPVYEVKAPTPSDPDKKFRPTALMEKVSRELEKSTTAKSQRQVLQFVAGKADHIRTALEILISEGFVSTEPGSRGAVLHTSTKAYRETEDPDSDKYQPQQDALA